ncbi:hypothetical protein [Hymenobacter guriensis]|uniref:Carboxypeptidase regulatory-like domain-containing protein n=1 Tax=Hymenobacter guriensis TaxID=2793065 RepID=A0ABS0KWX2_9BACT|nr:hypothetical protein [Hymenobacter guriensis]MBG8552361.1 hypothetical protein [Hymenobacter guriensis]
MALILVKRTVVPGEDRKKAVVTEWSYNTRTGEDETRTSTYNAPFPAPFTPSATKLLGFYCEDTTRVDVYPAYALDGTSRRERTPNATECPAPNSPATVDLLPAPANHFTAPAGAILLARSYRAVPREIGLLSQYDVYYLPSSHTVEVKEDLGFYTVADNPPRFTRTAAEILDRWCLASGQAPYTERRVYYAGVPDYIATIDYDNVATCQRLCGITVAGTATFNTSTGYGAITATTTGAVGPVLYRLDGTPDAGQTSPLFEELPQGLYPLTATETREGGCTATTLVRVVASYADRYRLAFKDFWNRDIVVRFPYLGYTGEAEDIIGSDVPLVLDWQAGAMETAFVPGIRGSECALDILLTYDNQLLDVFSGHERLVGVVVERDEQELWRGWILPEQYTVPHLSAPKPLQLQATDALATLSGKPFARPDGSPYRGMWSLLQVVQTCLGKTDLILPLRVLDNLYPVGGGPDLGSVLEQVFVDTYASYTTDKGEAWDCAEVLNAILESRGCRLYQWAGYWYWERFADLSTEEQTYFVFSAEGQSLPTATVEPLVSVEIPTEGHPHWVEASQTASERGAVKQVTVKAEPGEVANLLAPFLPADTATTLPGWSGAASYTLHYAGKGKTPEIELKSGIPGVFSGLLSYLETPVTVPIPLYKDQRQALIISGKITPVTGEYDTEDTTTQPFMRMVLVVNGKEYEPQLADADGFTTIVRLPQPGETYELQGFFPRRDAPLPQATSGASLRFYQPEVPGDGLPMDVRITDLKLHWQLDNLFGQIFSEEDYADKAIASNKLDVTRLDESLTLFHTDTPRVRRKGTLLGADSKPTNLWFEPAYPERQYQLIDWQASYRAICQRRPQQVLSGVLLGDLWPGALLTDPSEDTPGVYPLPACAYDVRNVEWTITAVQLLGLSVGAVEPGRLLYQAGDPRPIAGGYLLLQGNGS